MVKRGDVVLISVGGAKRNALVHQVNPFHEAGPSLHVSYVADDPIDNNTRKPKVMGIGYIPESVLLHDVTEWEEGTVIPTVDVSTPKELDDIAEQPKSPVVELDGNRTDVTVDLQAAADNEGFANLEQEKPNA